jgi:hypothetical protein
MDKNQKKRQQLGPADQPFETDDGILALALYFAQVPFVSDGLWMRNSYKAEFLREKFHGRNLTLIEAAKEAVKCGIKGFVRFSFQRPENLKNLASAFTDQEKHFEEAEGQARNVFLDLCEQFKNDKLSFDEFAARSTCLILKTRIQFMNAWKEKPPHIRIENIGRTERSKFPFTDDEGRVGTGTRVMHPGFKEFSVDAPKEVLEHMGL